ncbi:hypothetical protein L2E82_32275 [Cichorium intybus]|uniref:Uncharacterized protein n=1 Tax=Cichorium intybus TaxID=13427 RepID=A0ACB9BH56_CICIN|nr:hypothetical protein L2E82_32275 [Cichorium intybus]
MDSLQFGIAIGTSAGTSYQILLLDNIDDAFKWMNRIDKFEEKHLPSRPEYRLSDDMKETDDILMEKLNVIDRKLEEKLAQLDHTFGRKGKVLEEEIRDLAEERNSLTEKKRRPLFRKGGQLIKYTVMLACGNYDVVIDFAKGKGPAVRIACQKEPLATVVGKRNSG